MKLLYSYLKQYWKLVLLALVLAAVNQVFSLLDPQVFRIVIDKYATKFNHYTTGEFFKGVTLLLLLAVNFIGYLGFILCSHSLCLVSKLGGNSFVYRLASSVYSASQLIGTSTLGKWSDVYGRKKILLTCQIEILLS